MLSSNLRSVVVPDDASPRCYRCGERLAPGAVAMQGLLTAPFGFERVHELGLVFDRTRNDTRAAWFHLLCAVDVHPINAARVLAALERSDPEVEHARQMAFRRRMAFEFCAKNPRIASDVEPARDPKGRPRVSVIVVGSATTSTRQEWLAFEAFTHDFAVASPLREYVFRSLRSGELDGYSIDPSAPIVAGVIAALVDTKTVKAQREKLLAMHERKLAAPVLWILGDAHEAPRNAKATELREIAASAGFDGDACPVLFSSIVDEASIAQLALALDECASPASQPSLTDRFETLLASVERALLDRESSPLVQRIAALERWLSQHDSVSNTSDERVISRELAARARRAAIEALSFNDARESAMSVLWHFGDRRDVEAVAALARALLDERAHGLAPLFLSAHRFVRERDAQRALSLVIDGLFHERSAKRRRDALGALLLANKEPNVRALLRAKIAQRPKSDAAKDALALVTQIEALRP